MVMMPQTMIEVLTAGGGLSIDLSQHAMTRQILLELAAAARLSAATLIFRNIKVLLPQTMMEIAAAGGGRVVFEV